MHCLTKTIPFHYVIIFYSFFFLPFLSSSSDNPRTTVSGLFCGGRSKSSADPNYIPTFVEDMHSLSLKLTTRRFATESLNSTPSIYALIQCHHDLSPSDCQLCYAIARTRLPRCLPSSSARIFLDGCFLRYETYEFYDESVSNTSDSYSCSNDTVLDPLFGFQVSETAARVAVRKGGFGVAGESGVHALAQCWESLGKEDCRVCLEKAIQEVKRCVSRREGRAMNTGCYLRYSDHKFYNGDGHHLFHVFFNKGVIVAIVLTTSAFVMLILLATYVIMLKVSKTKQEQRNLGLVSRKFNNSKTKFKYETLEKATDYFSPKKILGQGGNGTVFLGILPNGKNVAVKRLVFNTREWVEEFFNEVNLISGIQHKNLVKLLGCSIEGPESLLVYEYVPNKSLDQFLFDETQSKVLNWSQRLNIILGTAEGLAYLHGGSPVRIIHRDIKTSNVLLDDQLNPKIADFGLARCFGLDKTHLSTGIAGTLGYMAPEYAVRGQLTEKADVYSFGVLVLEIACGTRNNTFVPVTGHLLQRVWNLYTLSRLVEALDQCLKDEFRHVQGSEAEAYKVLRVGLLCTQASPSLRPSMEEVIRMLTERDYPIPSPTNPPFLRISSLATDLEGGSTISQSTNSTTTFNTMVKTDQASFTSSESSTTRTN
ncbi:Protein kinase-like domain superfamily [Arabidopsis thaliana x Arabidopsis arenosa]|uniref:Protein kinase-like domain superfamily n=1 Tax=Arabidopsis thaliana x Arabidopsis arenosa TaxID=1240361 RepID=A0A8T1YDH0_9BRAS|nr:Protein kinase-like domain superfamily [Arabidopsis thaliana x Arabidopsis arenosa]